MQKELQGLWEKRVTRLKADIQSLRDKLASLRRENNDLKKNLKNRNRMFHSIPAGIVLIQQGKIMDINQLALDHLGFASDDVIGHSFLDFVHPDQKASVEELHKRRISGKVVPELYDADLVTKEGEPLCCEVRVKRIRFNNRLAFLVNLTPLEKRKKKERENHHSKKQEALITMASGLNNALRPHIESIMDHAGILKTIMDSETNALKEALERIEHASNKVLLMTQKLESISRRRDDKSKMIFLDLKGIVKDAVKLTSSTLKDQYEKDDFKINFKTYLRSVSPVKGDPEEIRELIINLILNAAHSMPEGGDIYLTSEENAGFANIYIQDNGVGISDEVRERIFDPFFTTRDNGVGLGLSLSSSIVKRHGGEMEVSSRKNQGTVIHVKLPLAKQEKIPKKRKRRAIKNARILIIQGENMIRELLSQLLTSKGCRVDTADSGFEGLRKVKNKRFDLIITDSETLETDLWVLIKKIKKMERKVPVALIMEYKTGEEPDHIQRSDVDLFIKKPIDMNKIINQVSEVLNKRY